MSVQIVIKKFYLLLFFCVLSLLFYSDGFGHHFFQDDWWHFYISDAKSVSDFFAFFNPQNSFDYQIYRPLSTQVVFFLYQNLVGFEPFLFRCITLLILGVNAYLVFKLSRQHAKPIPAFLLGALYLVHHQHIGLAYYLSTIQTTMAVLFVLLGMRSMQTKRRNWHSRLILLYLAALLSHEIAILSAVIFIIYLWPQKQTKEVRSLMLILLLTPILYALARFVSLDQQFFNNDHYQLSFSPKTLANTLMWYVAWLLSLPEYVINFVSSGFKPLPPLFGVFRTQTLISLSVLGVNIVVVGRLFLNRYFRAYSKEITSFVLSLLPVIFFPWHKYIYYLPLASIFFMLALAKASHRLSSAKAKVLLSLLIISATITNYIDRTNSASYQRGITANYLIRQIDTSSLREGDKALYIANDPNFQVFAKEWGSTSSQAKIVLREDLAAKLLTGNSQLQVIYEDDLAGNEKPPHDQKIIVPK